MLVFLVAAGLTFAAVYVNALRSASSLAIPRFVQAMLPRASLGLRVEYQGEHLLVSWDRRSPTVRSAISGVLRIEDGGQRRDVHLDATQVASGSVLYKPASDDVTFRLEVHNERGTATVESMRVLNSPNPVSANASAASQRDLTSPAQPTHKSDAPSTAERRMEIKRRPRATRYTSTTQPVDRTTHSPAASQPPPDGKTLSAFKPARALRQVMPDATSFASDTLLKTTQVAVGVTIDPGGRVTSARLVGAEAKKNSELASAALMAARQWVFEPATWHGKPVKGEHLIVFTFHATAR